MTVYDMDEPEALGKLEAITAPVYLDDWDEYWDEPEAGSGDYYRDDV